MYFNNHTSIYIKYDEVLHGNIYFTTKILGPVHAPPTFENATPLILHQRWRMHFTEMHYVDFINFVKLPT